MARINPVKMIWAARILIGTVLFFKVQCALQFIFWPGAFVSGFELSGVAGLAALQGMGILFLMWNVPYLTALMNPLRQRTSLVEAVCMQALGAGGETLLGLALPVGHAVLAASIQRFIVFDTGGLLCLLAAWGLVWRCLVLNARAHPGKMPVI